MVMKRKAKGEGEKVCALITLIIGGESYLWNEQGKGGANFSCCCRHWLPSTAGRSFKLIRQAPLLKPHFVHLDRKSDSWQCLFRLAEQLNQFTLTKWMDRVEARQQGAEFLLRENVPSQMLFTLWGTASLRFLSEVNFGSAGAGIIR